jgi:Skp family chaperone for outer membrane proteins
MSRGSRSSQLNPSFFAFQDIIASVIGILLLIALRLALEVVESSPSGIPGNAAEGSQPGAAPKVMEILEELAEVNARNLELSRQLQSLGPQKSAAEVTAEIEVMTLNLGEAQKELDRCTAKADALRQELERKDQDAQIPRLLGELKDLEFELARLERSAPEENKLLESLREAVAKLQQNLIAERKLDNQLLMIPAAARSLKEPAMLVIGKSEVIALSLPYTGNPLAAIDVALEECRSDRQYVVLFFKPSAASVFTLVREYVKGKGFEVGYDLLSEETNLRLSEEVGK